MDCSPPGSSVHGISQIRILEWVAISFSGGSLEPMSPALAGRFFTAQSPGRPGIAHRLEKTGLGIGVWPQSPGWSVLLSSDWTDTSSCFFVTCLGPENGEKRGHMWAALYALQSPPPLASGRVMWEDPVLHWEFTHQILQQFAGWAPGHCLSTQAGRLHPGQFPSWENNVSAFLFAEIITDLWLLGLFNGQTMMAVMINARVKTFCWACVSFYSLTHSPNFQFCPWLGICYQLGRQCLLTFIFRT